MRRQEIAAAMGISPETVKKQVHRILEQTGEPRLDRVLQRIHRVRRQADRKRAR